MINLLYAGNDRVFDGLLFSLVSLTKHTKEPIHAYILTMDLTNQNKDWKPISKQQIDVISDVIKKTNSQNVIEVIDVTEIYLKNFSNSKNQNTRCTPYTLLRLIAPDLAELETLDKILYLDTDTIINNDISVLYNEDISNFEVGVVRDILPRNRWYFRNYFNAGMLLINLNEVRKSNAFNKSAVLCLSKKMSFADQDALNKTIKKRRMLNYKYNWFRKHCKYYDDIVVHHFCDARNVDNKNERIKPWHTEKFLKAFPMYSSLVSEVQDIKKQNNL